MGSQPAPIVTPTLLVFGLEISVIGRFRLGSRSGAKRTDVDVPKQMALDIVVDGRSKNVEYKSRC